MLQLDSRQWKSTRALLPVLVVVLSLLSLVFLPLMVERRVFALHAEITQLSDPLHAAVRDVQFYLALETAGTRGYLLTGDPAYAAKHQAARTQRQQQLARIVALTDRSPAEVRNLGAGLPELFRTPDARLDSLYAGSLTRAEFQLRLPAQQVQLEAVTAAVSAIGNIVSRSNAASLARAKSVHRTSTILTFVLVTLAALAAVLVARLGLAQAALAARAQAARAESDAARAEAENRRLHAERLAESRATLMRGFSHDVRTPLNAAAGYLALVEQGIIPPDEGARRVKQSVYAAVSLIDDLLEFARADIGEIRVHRESVDLSATLHQVADEWRPAIESRGLTLNVEIAADEPLPETDPARIHQVLTNLLSNAAKYTKEGGIVLRLSTDRREGGGDWVRLEVSDTGPGLVPEERAQLFREFHRLATAGGTPGNGLGLAISLRIAQALGGTIAVQSEPGTGSTFSLLLPCERQALAPAGE